MSDIDETQNIQTEEIEKPRKRKITKNIQLYVTAAVSISALLTIIIWNLFFNQSLTGDWSYTETAFDISDTSDSADEAVTATSAEGHVTYSFTKDGDCKVTIGSTSVLGYYELASTKEYGNVATIAVFYGSNPVVYGNYSYKITGNVFTGKKLTLENVYYDDDIQTFTSGKAEDTLTPFDDPQFDDKLIGSWYDSTNDIFYEFKENGEMIRTVSDTFTVKHYYTVMGENSFIAKYSTYSEQVQSYSYKFIGDDLYIDDYKLVKTD